MSSVVDIATGSICAPLVHVRHPQHTQTSSNSSTIAADSSNGVTNTRCCRYSFVCAPDDGWKHHPKHVEQFLHINKRCNVVSCWIYSILEYTYDARNHKC
jgi:hypothetical protein